jgi:hypothetical protein
MNLSLPAQQLRELRRWLRAAVDNVADVGDCVGPIDREQQRRLRELVREIEAEIAELDKKINLALAAAVRQ